LPSFALSSGSTVAEAPWGEPPTPDPSPDPFSKEGLMKALHLGLLTSLTLGCAACAPPASRHDGAPQATAPATVKGHQLLRGYGTPTVTSLTGSPGPSGATSLPSLNLLLATALPVYQPPSPSWWYSCGASLPTPVAVLRFPCRAKRRWALRARNLPRDNPADGVPSVPAFEDAPNHAGGWGPLLPPARSPEPCLPKRTVVRSAASSRPHGPPTSTPFPAPASDSSDRGCSAPRSCATTGPAAPPSWPRRRPGSPASP